MPHRPVLRRRIAIEVAVYVLWGLWLSAIMVVSFIPEEAPLSQAIPSALGNLGHVPAYAILTVLTTLVLTRVLTAIAKWRVWAAAVFASLLGLTIELAQPAFGRAMGLSDVFYNQVGIIAALFLCLRLRASATDRTMPESTKSLLEDAGFGPVEHANRAHGHPAILVRPVRDEDLHREWMVAGRRLLDVANWDLRMLYHE